MLLRNASCILLVVCKTLGIKSLIEIRELGGRIVTEESVTMLHKNKTVHSVQIGNDTIEIFDVVWTAPINLAAKQPDLPSADLDYLGLLLFNVMVENEDAPRDYQWCYYGETNLLINRVSTPRFLSPDTCPSNGVGYCCEVTCMVGDDRWKSGENLTDWIIDDLVKVGMIKDRSKVVDVQIERIPHSYPIYSENYPTELARMRESISQFENLHLAGRTGLFWYNNMDHSMENAFQLSRRLLKNEIFTLMSLY